MNERRSKVLGAVLLLAVFIWQPLRAQENAAPANTNLHSLWKVEGKSNVVYLMGSIHLLKPDNYPLPAALESAFSNSQVAVFETDVDQLADPALQMKMMSKGALPAGETLQQHLSPATYAAFTNEVQASGLPLQMLEPLKPSLAAMVVGLVEIAKLGADPQYGLDKYFSDKAHKEGKQVMGLETADFQIDLITGFSPDEDEAMMKMSLDDINKTKAEFGDMMKAWQTGDSPAIEKLLNDSLEKVPTLYHRMVTDRNKRWVPKIEELLHGDKNAIVIVGSAHLVGKEGVVELLKAKGYKVTQL
jgi:hypothetical protein